ncbi:MAG TPA: AMP-binding protein [Ramlibacter sp.]|uniref:class I adenylate-forming enzyme family protein n=1 Tax=Ramlibacter sp. TaxID=1917967 RepID=UPI002C5F8547|nr:AMP-binding protein [Ramlibacter sp.]HVZ46560.1 AMP-binding protein [Ramlibacter sp.]
MRASRDLPLTTAQEADRYRRSGAWPDETVYERFERIALRYGDKNAVIEADRVLTYSQLLERVRALSRGLLDAGIRQGDVVAVQMPNSAEIPIAHLALNRIGALAMPIHESWLDAELPHLLSLGKAVAAIMPSRLKDVDYPALYATLRPKLPQLQQVWALGEPSPHADSFDALLERGSEEAVRALGPVDPDAPGDLMLSSGTTSMPKVSVFSSNGLMALLQPFWKRIQIRPDDVAAALAPAGTGAIGYVYPILSPLLNGATTVILERWGDPELAVDLIIRNRCTYATGVPAQLTQMLPAISARSPGDFAAFRCFTNAGAPLSPDVGREVEEKMGCKIFVIYGATDGGVASCTSIEEDTQEQRLTTVGRPQDECEIRLMNEVGEPLPAGPDVTGEIQWRCADKSYGYLNDPEATAMAFTSDRFYRTGDLGSFDESGRLRIVGRVKDMIIRGGRNISPRLIEEMVGRDPRVLEVAVAAYPDKVLGERACAFVVPRSGTAISLPSLLEFLRTQQMPTWQMPERLELLTELPKSAGGKVMKNKLREYVAAKVRTEEAAAESAKA